MPEQPLILSSLTTRFAIDLFKALVTETPEENVFISPIGVATVLAMALNGAAGETFGVMAETLGVSDLSLDEINASSRAVIGSLASPGDDTQITLASSLWGNQRISFKKDFLDRAKSSFDAWLTSMDFTDKGAPDLINNWVNARTNGRIAHLIDKVDPLDLLILINVAVFKGTWKSPFDKRATKPEDFTGPSGARKSIPMMHSWSKRAYFEDRQVQVVQLPYGSGRIGMLVALPAEGIALADFMVDLTPDVLARWIGGLVNPTVNLTFPRFTLEASRELKEPLSAMGMGDTFDPRKASFKGMAEIDEPIWISKVKHNTFLKVDEEGTEAAAATAVVMTTRSAMIPQKIIEMKITRPFLLAITDQDTGAILFLGAINDPQEIGS